MSTVLDVESPARLAANLRASVSTVVKVARDLGITPALTVDGRGYFSASDAHRIAAALRDETADQPVEGADR